MIKGVLTHYLPQRLIDNFAAHYHSIGFKPPLLIYQMGKVGSSTMHQSLAAAKLPYSIYHVHFLSADGVKSAEAHYRKLKVNLPRHVLLSKILRKRLLGRAGVQWKIITLVREPIQRLVSDFFQNVKDYWPELVGENGIVKKTEALHFIRDMLNQFDETTDYASSWFDMEVKGVFNVDIYTHPFDHQNGFSIISEGNAKILVLKAEDLDRSFEAAMTQFLKSDTPIRMLKGNIGLEKEYAKEYKYVLANLVLPKAVCGRIYSSKYARHFYAESVRNELARKWSGEQKRV